MTQDYSFAALMSFLDYLSEKGLMKKNTVISRKAATNKMLSILDASEQSDIRRIDIDSLSTRFANLEGSKYSPKSLQVYKSRTSGAIADFLRYKENPANFSIQTKTRTTRQTTTPENAGFSASEAPKKPTNSALITETNEPHTINIPIPINPNCIVYVNGIPVGLTKTEAQKIANVVLAMATTEV